jgi:hypothetical protein
MNNQKFKRVMKRGDKLLLLVFFVASLLILMGTGDSYGEIISPDRRIDWSPGISGGVPSRTTIYANVKASPYNAYGDDSHDDTATIQKAINDCPEGQVVFLPAGTYKVTSELRIQKGIVLRGAGVGQTLIKNYATGDGNIVSILGGSVGSPIAATFGYTKGSTEITVSSTSGLKVGDYIRIYQTNDPDVVKDGYDTCTWCANVIAQIVQVTGLSGNRISINRPLYYTYKASLNPNIVKLTMVQNAGVENLGVEKVNGGGSYANRNNFFVRRAARSWIRNIDSYKVVGAHVKLQDAYGCEIRESNFNEAHATSSGRGYGVFFLSDSGGYVSSDNLIENNIFYKLRHAMNIEGGGQGNVFAYNYSVYPNDTSNPTWMEADLNANHAKHGMFNLFEGNIVGKIHGDNTFGSSSYNTFFRNHVTRESLPQIDYALWAVTIDQNNTYYNVVGNVLCTPGCVGQYEPANISSSMKVIWRIGYNSASDSNGNDNDPNPGATLLRHGNFDYVTQETHWDPNIADHNLPNSYYLSSKPSFFGNLAWPAIGPDLNPMVETLPAKVRYEESETWPPRPPQNLRIVR